MFASGVGDSCVSLFSRPFFLYFLVSFSLTHQSKKVKLTALHPLRQLHHIHHRDLHPQIHQPPDYQRPNPPTAPRNNSHLAAPRSPPHPPTPHPPRIQRNAVQQPVQRAREPQRNTPFQGAQERRIARRVAQPGDAVCEVVAQEEWGWRGGEEPEEGGAEEGVEGEVGKGEGGECGGLLECCRGHFGVRMVWFGRVGRWYK